MEMPETMLVNTGKCPFCGEEGSVLVIKEQYLAWKKAGPGDPNRFIQHAMPEMPADKREQLINGSHGKCFDLAFSEPEDDDDVVWDQHGDQLEWE